MRIKELPRHITEYFYDSIDVIIARIIVGDKKYHKKNVVQNSSTINNMK